MDLLAKFEICIPVGEECTFGLFAVCSLHTSSFRKSHAFSFSLINKDKDAPGKIQAGILTSC